jgi:GNAT superfamily N-acetyltransferase
MLVQLVAGATPATHVRPFDPAHDLAALADLIEIAFGRELALTGNRMVQDMRQMALFGPLVSAFNAISPIFSGYVWVEDGLVVGNASVFPAKTPRGWTIANVAVLPAYRNRGIASQLVDVALDHVHQARGRRVLLQVRDDNPQAQAIYLHRGFQAYERVHEMVISPGPWPVVVGAPSLPLRDLRAGDGRRLFGLVSACTPDGVKRVLPLEPRPFSRGLGWRLVRFFRQGLAGKECFELVGASQGDLRAYLKGTVQLLSGPHEIALYVHPNQRGLWEKTLAETALQLLQHAPPRGAKAEISTSHPSAVMALEQIGFRTHRVLQQMVRDLP